MKLLAQSLKVECFSAAWTWNEKGLCQLYRLLMGIILLSITTTSGSQQPQHQESSTIKPPIVDVADERKNAVVQIHALAFDGTESYGTGFLVTDDGIVLTSANVISSVKDVKVSRFGETYDAEVLFRGSESESLAILQTKCRGRKLRISNHEPNVKDQVSAIGWESTPEPRLSSDVGSIVDIVGNKIYYARSSDSRPGFSGGPVINEQGDVVGIHIGKLFGASVAWALNVRSQFPILKKFGIFEEDLSSVDTQVYPVVVGCEGVDERSQSVDFHLPSGQQIVDADAVVAEQAHLTGSKVGIERVVGSVVIVHSWVRGEPRRGLLGLPVGPCDTGHALIQVHVRVKKSPDTP